MTPREIFEKAKRFLPGGVSYGLRYIAPCPFYAVRAEGNRLWDTEGEEYLDYWMGHGAVLTGHGDRLVIDAVKDQLQYGAHFGIAHEWEVKWAEQICRMIPSAEMVRPTNSGSEANMYAIRLARAYTGRSAIGKFAGHWHGGYDALHKATNYPYDRPGSLGLTDGTLGDTVVLPFNDLDGVRAAVKGKELASISLEVVMGAAGFLPAEKQFLEGLRALCDEEGIVLIFDEVITGFRFPGGAQAQYGVTPDLTILGKTVGGQYFPAGAFCGRADVMERLDHLKYPAFYERPFHGGTYSGNPIAARAGYTLLCELEKRKDEIYARLDALGERMRNGLVRVFDEQGVAAYVTGAGSLFGVHFTDEKPVDGVTAECTKDLARTKAFFAFMLAHNVFYFSPNVIHAFISAAHTEADIDRFLALTEEFAAGAAR